MRSARSTWAALLSCCDCLAPAPLAAQPISVDLVATIPGPADRVRVSGTYAYVSTDATLRVIDISEPSTPKPRGTLQLPAAATAVAVFGSMVYATMGLRGLAIVDVKNADAPSVVGLYKTAGEALRLAADGTRVVLTDRMAGADVIDVTNAAKPISLGAHYTDGYTRDVAILGSVAYVIDSTNDFATVDLSHGGEPRALATQSGSITSTLVTVSSPQAGQRFAYVAGDGSLQVFDVTEASAPRRLAVTTISNRTTALVVKDDVGYLAVGEEGIQMLDLSNPASPALVGSYGTSGAPRDIDVSGDLIFAAVSGGRAAQTGSPATASQAGALLILRRRR